jgi:hypothetical protein
MTPDSLAKRVFLCFLLVLILIGCVGCQSVKWEWLPQGKKLKANKEAPRFSDTRPFIKRGEAGGPTPKGITILKGSF